MQSVLHFMFSFTQATVGRKHSKKGFDFFSKFEQEAVLAAVLAGLQPTACAGQQHAQP